MAVYVIKKYELIETKRLEDLIERVNQMITEGWEPYGSPIITGGNDTYDCYYGQAMILKGLP